jgi:hypothetical protein
MNPYIQINSLPDDGKFIVDIHESKAIQLALFDMGFSWGAGSNRNKITHPKREFLRQDGKYLLTWRITTYYNASVNGVITEEYRKIIQYATSYPASGKELEDTTNILNFEEYFKLDKRFTGWKAGLSYGI